MKKQIISIGMATLIGINIPINSEVYANMLDNIQNQVETSEEIIWENYDSCGA